MSNIVNIFTILREMLGADSKSELEMFSNDKIKDDLYLLKLHDLYSDIWE